MIQVPLLAAALAQAAAQPARTQPQVTAPTDVKPGSINLDDVEYPCTRLVRLVSDLRAGRSDGDMDVPPAGQPNGRTVVLFHGMNFSGFYFAGLIDVLRKEGFRVVVTDQIGFGRSSKPIIPYNFHDMALNSKRVLDQLGIRKAMIVGHSMGGMLAARFAASYPDVTEKVVLYAPIGLTDARWERPYRSTDDAYKARLAQNHDQEWAQALGTLKRYFPKPETWKPEYDRMARIMTRGR